jgi:uncharacterized membrane protein YraQ (UPF0718 family)/copper chaperone CopZ
MLHFLTALFQETLSFYNEVAIYLLLGFGVAGVLHVFFPESLIRRQLGQSSFGSVLKATLIGIPLPLCSCGVVPVSAALRTKGASKGATVSFMIATPQVGADSFMITYSLLGWVFAFFRIAAALITSLSAGILVNIFGGKNPVSGRASPIPGPRESISDRLGTLVPYIEYTLLGSIANSLVAGIILAGLIAAIIPADFFSHYLHGDFLSMVIMMLVGIPMYVCATASTPIAASLVLKGMAPGAALVFLLTGPATNAVTIATVYKRLGLRSVVIYLGAIAGVSLALGYLLNVLVNRFGLSLAISRGQHKMLPDWVLHSGSVLLAGMLVWYYLKTHWEKLKARRIIMKPEETVLSVEGMTCNHCVENVKKAVQSVLGAVEVQVNLPKKEVRFLLRDPKRRGLVQMAIEQAGYSIK